MGYSPWSRKESDTTEQLHFHFFFPVVRNPLVSAKDPGTIPGQGAKSPYAAGQLGPHTSAETQQTPPQSKEKATLNLLAIAPHSLPTSASAFVVVQLLSCVRVCDPVDCSTPGFPPSLCPRAQSDSCSLNW